MKQEMQKNTTCQYFSNVGKRKQKGQRSISEACQWEVPGRNPGVGYLDQNVVAFPVNNATTHTSLAH